MKTVLILAAALGLSASVASADCMGHGKVTASADVDREFKTASISNTPQTPVDQALLLKKDGKADTKAEATE